jgi:Sulfotransferase domain
MTGFKAKPILLTGIPRSGTTWVGRMLVTGGGLGYLNEPFNLARSPGTVRVPVGHWFPYVTEENEADVLARLTKLLRFRYPLARELSHCRNRTDLLHTMKTWKDFVRSRGRRPLVKEPHAVFSSAWFAQRLDADVVVIVRHPAAVVSSWTRLGWSFDFQNLLEQPALIRDRLARFEQELRTALEPSADVVGRIALLWRVVYETVADLNDELEQLTIVRHEDLSRDPIEGFRALYERLGLSFSRETERAIAASSSADNPKETAVDRPHETRIDSRANLAHWKNRLTQDEVRRVRELTEPAATRYYTDDDWA